MISPKIFIGPMSKNIVDSVIEYANSNNFPLGLIPSRRQVEYDGGYVNNWTTVDFCNYIKKNTKNILLVRDHSGPDQGLTSDDGLASFDTDCNNFHVIHVDVWKKYKTYNDGLEKTIEFITRGSNLNKNIFFEVSTEESIRKFSPHEINNLLRDLKNELSPEIFDKIIYCVIQSGTSLKELSNTGEYNPSRLSEMVNSVLEYNKITKEHNGDYISNNILTEKFSIGLNSINVAPEFGQIETNVIIDEMLLTNPKLIDDFFKICLDSGKWIKWVDSSFNPHENKLQLIKICGHYVFSDENFLSLKKLLSPDIDNKIKNKIYNKIDDMVNSVYTIREKKIIQYFNFFSKKDTVNLKKLFSNDVKLKDWNINEYGINNVMLANKNIFNSVKSLSIEIIDIFKNSKNDTYSCEIIINIDGVEKLNVVDIIGFDSDNNINSITAFKR